MVPTAYFGLGETKQVDAILEQRRPRSVLMITGKNSYILSGAEQKLGNSLRNFRVTHFTDFSVNAKIEDVKRGLAVFRENKCDLVMAVGGGSAMDVAKAVAILATQDEPAEKYILRLSPLQARVIPLLAIPTTAGTGSEATHFAAIYIDNVKYSLAHESLLPDYAIIDPSLTFSLPAYKTACTGMDALSQAVESYWSIYSTEKSKCYAQQAITLALNHLNSAVRHPDSEARIAMASAANLAGKAINISFTTACHAVSYPITANFNVPHGHAVALTLPEMVVYNAATTKNNCLDHRGVKYVHGMMHDLCMLFGVASPEGVKIKIERLMDGIGLERKLARLGIKQDQDIDTIINQGFNPERVRNNPREVKPDELRSMLQAIR